MCITKKSKTEPQKIYLLCELGDEHYTDPSFIQFTDFDSAYREAIHDCAYCFDDESVIEIDENRERVSASSGDKFFITEIKEVDVSNGDYMLVWHHAYNGVDFNILMVGTYEECVARRIKGFEMIFEEYDLSNADNEGFDIQTDTCIDTGEEWEIFSIVKINKDV